MCGIEIKLVDKYRLIILIVRAWSEKKLIIHRSVYDQKLEQSTKKKNIKKHKMLTNKIFMTEETPLISSLKPLFSCYLLLEKRLGEDNVMLEEITC